MRIFLGAAIAVTLGLGAACSSRSDPPATTPAAQAAGGAQTAPAAPTTAKPAPAPAVARITEAQVDAAMKQVGQTNGVLQKAVKANMLPEAATAAKQLATIFADVERFFQENKKPDAVALAQTARTGAADAAAGAAAGDQMKAAAGAAAMGATCKQCHSVYREGVAPDYRVKAGTVIP